MELGRPPHNWYGEGVCVCVLQGFSVQVYSHWLALSSVCVCLTGPLCPPLGTLLWPHVLTHLPAYHQSLVF